MSAVKRIPPVATPVTVPREGFPPGPKASASPPIVAMPATPGPTKFRPPSSEDQKKSVVSAIDGSPPGFGTGCGKRCETMATWSLMALTWGPSASSESASAPGGTSLWVTSHAFAARSTRQ